MAAGPTFDPIASVTLSASQNAVTFSGIPQTFTDLVVVQSGLTTGGTGIRLRFNNDSGSNYSDTMLFGTGSAAGSARESNITSIRMTYEASGQTTDIGIRMAHIMNYANSVTHKIALARSGRAASGIDAIVGLSRSTSPVTSLTVFGSDFNLDAGTTIDLFGIASA